MATINIPATGTVVQPEDQYIVVWPESDDTNSKFNMNIGNKVTTEFLLSKLSNEGIKTVLSSKVVITIQEK